MFRLTMHRLRMQRRVPINGRRVSGSPNT
jgi:hypothetical protein